MVTAGLAGNAPGCRSAMNSLIQPLAGGIKNNGPRMGAADRMKVCTPNPGKSYIVVTCPETSTLLPHCSRHRRDCHQNEHCSIKPCSDPPPSTWSVAPKFAVGELNGSLSTVGCKLPEKGGVEPFVNFLSH